MRTWEYGERIGGRAVIALGFFDSIHLGHRELLRTARELAAESHAISLVFTFANLPFVKESVRTGLVYTLNERRAIFDRLGMDGIVEAEFDENFRKLSAAEFLLKLTAMCDVTAIVCGEDYTYGVDRSGTVATLRAYCEVSGIELRVVPMIESDGERISTTRIRELIASGEIDRANSLLGENWHMTGVVAHGRGEGRRYDVPTCNIAADSEKLLPPDGVYGTKVTCSEGTFYAVTNVGAKPTFGDFTPSVETYLIGYEGNLYGREITVSFCEYLRPIKKFDTREALYAQIARDIRWYL